MRTRSFSIGSWATVGNLTVYMDIPVPFTKYVVSLDIGRHSGIGYRWKRDEGARRTTRR